MPEAASKAASPLGSFPFENEGKRSLQKSGAANRSGTSMPRFAHSLSIANLSSLLLKASWVAYVTTSTRSFMRDNYPKLVTTRADPIQRRNGIVHENATDLIGRGWASGQGTLDLHPLESARTGAQLEVELGYP